MRIRPARGFSDGLMYNPKHILQKHPNTVFIYANNTSIAVINPPDNIRNIHTLAMCVEEDIPLWKQHMNMQMGRPHRTSRASLMSCYFQVFDDFCALQRTYSVYECY